MTKTLLLTSAFAFLSVLACSGDDGCPDGHVKVDGACEPYVMGFAGQGGGSGSGPVNQAGAPAGGSATDEVAFAELCASHTDCRGTTDYCAQSPTEPAYCSAKGCDADATMCPAGWGCMDVGQFVPGEPFVCVKLPPTGGGAFGDKCNVKTDCQGETNYCNYSPADGFYCSASGCDADPSVCPDGWSCVDVGQFIPGEPFVCAKPLPPAGNGEIGAYCNADADCTVGSNYCTFSPSEPSYCSNSGCDADASLCPTDWSCVDLGQFSPGLPFVCLKPPPPAP